MRTHFLAAFGDRIRLDGNAHWWDVRVAASGPFAVVTQQAPFTPRGTLRYAAIDLDRGVRGPVNLIGGGFGDGTYSDEECWHMLAMLLAGDIEVTHRNPAPLNITDHTLFGDACDCAAYGDEVWPAHTARPTSAGISR